MKKIIFVGFLLFAGIAGTKFNVSRQGNTSVFTLSTLMNIAQAGPEGCITQPGNNKGWCRENVGGGWNCLKEDWPYNCFSD